MQIIDDKQRVSVRLNNQDGTGAAMVYVPLVEIRYASLLRYDGNNYAYAHIASDCLVYVRCSPPLNVNEYTGAI